jgi:pimeloyl-ACP methyl ester carboxylesterase
MRRSSPVGRFQLAYERSGSGPAAVLLHGWPGDHADYRRVVPLLGGHADVVTPDLRGFGHSDRHFVPPAEGYSAAAQARSVIGLIEELGLAPAVVAGYDVGSRVAQTIARARPDLVRELAISPPLPGAGERVLSESAQRELWYQSFHQLSLAERLIDGDRSAVRAYLRHFWSHWSGPAFDQADADLDRLVGLYSPAGAFTASIAWYRAGSGTVATSLRELTEEPPAPIPVPVTVLWPELDPLFPRAWGDRIADHFTDVGLIEVDGVGHFVPLEAPEAVASAIGAAITAGA